MFGTVLIANRGEIALRIVRACRELGVRSVVAHSTADRDSAAVALADAAVQIGPGPSRRSYLNIAALVEAAHQSGAEAVHPGYGFLSEDPDFAEVCAAEGLTFVGPPPAVIAELGDKSAARRLMHGAGLPMLPGSLEPLEDRAAARALADGIGYPVVVKAVAGGGGRGIGLVEHADDFEQVFDRTRAEARSLFGDGRVFVERYVRDGRHVEVQILADGHGSVLHLGTRDCSVQRRHQKLVEEAPAPGLDPTQAALMGEVSVAGARAAGYVNAGTFEFLLCPDGTFAFLEVNCRLQVEHPVTEMVTGVDLVREQLRVAAGERLGFAQDDVRIHGSAVECRLNVEDPERDFAPTPGLLDEFVPSGGPFVRVDTHGYAGYRVPPHYDSLLAKVVAWGPDRGLALDRADRALAEFRVRGGGVATTRDFLRRVLADPEFRAADHSTALVEQLLVAAR